MTPPRPIVLDARRCNLVAWRAAIEAAPSAGLLLVVPPSWCYRALRKGRPGTWSRARREALRPALFPQAPEDLHWDERLTPDGTWETLALSRHRLAPLLEALGPGLPGRPFCVRPAGHPPAPLSAYPNLAPVPLRPRRVPWRLIGRILRIAGPLLAVVLGGGWGLHRLNAHRQVLAQELAALTARSDRLQVEVQRERSLLRAFGANHQPDETPAWMHHLDALTRLLPEDTRVVDFQWSPGGLRIDLLTPRPEAIREALEASPEFQAVRFEGTLDRRGDRSRLVLRLEPEVNP